MEAATCSTISAGRLLRFAEKRIKECGVADIVPQFAMLEEDVDRLPQRVIQDLHQLLMDERILRGRLEANRNRRGPGSSNVIAPRGARLRARPRLPHRPRAGRIP